MAIDLNEIRRKVQERKQEEMAVTPSGEIVIRQGHDIRAGEFRVPERAFYAPAV